MSISPALASSNLPPVPLAAGESRRTWPAFAALAVFWLLVLNQQRLEWVVNPVYSYGWTVPVLTGWLLWLRWTDRPAAGPVLGAGWFIGGMVLVFAAYFPVRVVQEANPDWVKINWMMAGLWLSAVLLAIGRSGGLPWARHLLAPLLFSFTALPWPVWMEESLSQTLMGLNAAVSAEAITLLGTPAMAMGNLIQVGDQWVNVEEACSGIRSLQTAFMMSLFLGEFYRMSGVRRGVLLASSFAVAFVVNLVRTVVLTNFAKTGDLDRWHDTVGTVAMVICLAGLWLLAELMQRRVSRAPELPVIKRAPLIGPFSFAGMLVACLWLGAAEVATRGWYFAHERRLAAPLTWDLQWPRESPDFVEGEFAERMMALLKFNHGATAGWKSPEGDRWQMYYLEWLPGRVSRFLSSAHYPTVCLPASGITLVSEMGVWTCLVDGVEIPFTTYLFDEGGQDVYVFHAVIEDRPAEGATVLGYRQVSSSERLDSVVRGERNLGQKVVGIAVRGPLSPSAARDAVVDMLGSVLAITPAELETRTASR